VRRHGGDDVRLRDRLSVADGKWFVRVRLRDPLRRDKFVARHGGHHLQHAFVGDAAFAIWASTISRRSSGEFVGGAIAGGKEAIKTYSILGIANFSKGSHSASPTLTRFAFSRVCHHLHGRSVTYPAILDFRAGVRNENAL